MGRDTGGMASAETYVETVDRPVRISSPDKVMFPEQGWTKLDLAQHYVQCGVGALRGVYNRPTMLKRWNRGVGDKPLFVKRPKGARTLVDVDFPSSSPGKMFVPLDTADVVWMAQQNCVDLNPWATRADDLLHADELRLDLDPTKGFTFAHVKDIAIETKALLDELGLVSWPKTSGNRGIHVYVRLAPLWDPYQVRRAALAIGRELERRTALATTAWWKEERSGVFIDYNQNAWGKTVASAYSVRQTGWVSTPFMWEEVAAIEPAEFPMDTFAERWTAVGDLTDGIDEAAGDLSRALTMVEADEARGIGDAPWPPHYPKMPGEPPRVAPSKRRDENWTQ